MIVFYRIRSPSIAHSIFFDHPFIAVFFGEFFGSSMSFENPSLPP